MSAERHLVYTVEPHKLQSYLTVTQFRYTDIHTSNMISNQSSQFLHDVLGSSLLLTRTFAL